jgi:hypothetical protein
MLDEIQLQAGAYLDRALSPELLPYGLALGLLAFILAHWLRHRREAQSGAKAPPFTVLDMAALFAGGVSASTSASTMYGVLTGTPTATQMVGTLGFGAMICLAMILYSRGLLMQARLITLASVITSAATFHAYIAKGEQTAQDQAQRKTEIAQQRTALEKDIAEATEAQRIAKASIQSALDSVAAGNARIADLLAAETEARRAAEAAAAAARQDAPTDDPLAPERARVARLREDVDRLQAVADCELHGSASLPGCVGQDGDPVLKAGDGPLWRGARDAANAAREELKPIVEALAEAEKARAAERGEAAQARVALAAIRAAELESRASARRAAEEAVAQASASLPALREDAARKEKRSDELRRKLEGLTVTGSEWGAQVWAAILLMLVNNPVGRFIGATPEGVKICGGLLISLLFDLLASLWRVHARPRRPSLGLVGWLRRMWLSLVRGDVAVAALEAHAERSWILADQARHAARLQAEIERERTLGALGDYRAAVQAGADPASLADLSAKLDAQLARNALPAPPSGPTRAGRIAGALGRLAGDVGSEVVRIAAGGVGLKVTPRPATAPETQPAAAAGAPAADAGEPEAAGARPVSAPAEPAETGEQRTGLFSRIRFGKPAEPEADTPKAADQAEPEADAPEAADQAEPEADAPEAADQAETEADAPEAADQAEPKADDGWMAEARRMAAEMERRHEPEPEPAAEAPLDLDTLAGASVQPEQGAPAEGPASPASTADQDAAELARRRQELREKRRGGLGLHDIGDDQAEPERAAGARQRPFDEYPADYISGAPAGAGAGFRDHGDDGSSVFDPESLELEAGGTVGDGLAPVNADDLNPERQRSTLHNGLMRRRPTDLAEGGLVVSNGAFRPTAEMAKNAEYFRDQKALKRLAMREANRLVGQGMNRDEAARTAWANVNAGAKRGQVREA